MLFPPAKGRSSKGFVCDKGLGGCDAFRAHRIIQSKHRSATQSVDPNCFRNTSICQRSARSTSSSKSHLPMNSIDFISHSSSPSSSILLMIHTVFAVLRPPCRRRRRRRRCPLTGRFRRVRLRRSPAVLRRSGSRGQRRIRFVRQPGQSQRRQWRLRRGGGRRLRRRWGRWQQHGGGFLRKQFPPDAWLGNPGMGGSGGDQVGERGGAFLWALKASWRAMGGG